MRKLYFNRFMIVLTRLTVFPFMVSVLVIQSLRFIITSSYYFLKGGGEWILYKNHNPAIIGTLIEKLVKQEEQTEDFKQRGY